MANHEQWLIDKVQYIKGKKKPTDQESLLVTLAELQTKSPEDEKILDALVKAEKAEEAAKAARLAVKTKLDAQAEEARKLENGQKIILGGFFLHELRTNPKTRDWFLKEWEAKISRENDQKRLLPLVAELSKSSEKTMGGNNEVLENFVLEYSNDVRSSS